MGSTHFNFGPSRTMQLPADTVCYLLCQAVIGYPDSDPAPFTNHMKREHQITCNVDFLLVACLMDKEEREAVQGVIEAKQLELAGEGFEKSENTNGDNQTNKPSLPEKKIQEKTYKCDVCHKSCASQMYLRKHKMIHVQCEVCEKTYYNSSSLKKHMIVHAV